jgi:putative transposase
MDGYPGYPSALDIMVVQIDGIHISDQFVLVAALGIDSQGFKHPFGLMEGATEHSAVVQALIDDLIERGLDPAVPRLFTIDGSKALAQAIRRSFGRHTPIQRCQIHYAELRIMPTSAAKPAWEAVIAVKEAA